MSASFKMTVDSYSVVRNRTIIATVLYKSEGFVGYVLSPFLTVTRNEAVVCSFGGYKLY